MKKIFFGGLIFSLFPFYDIAAQQVITKDTISGTPLTMSMDPNVNGVMKNLEDNCAMVNAKRAERNNDEEGDSHAAGTSTPKNAVKVVANRALTTAEICRQNPRMMGIKIQLVVVKSNDEANEVKAYFRRRFPNLKVEVDASLRPNYKVLAGSYFNKQSAAGDLSKIRQYFKSAIPVQYRIFCAEAK